MIKPLSAEQLVLVSKLHELVGGIDPSIRDKVEIRMSAMDLATLLYDILEYRKTSPTVASERDAMESFFDAVREGDFTATVRYTPSPIREALEKMKQLPQSHEISMKNPKSS